MLPTRRPDGFLGVKPEFWYPAPVGRAEIFALAGAGSCNQRYPGRSSLSF
jgi:hypothetical protein